MKRCLLSLLIIACALITPRPMHADPRHPNIIVILADDLGYGDVGFNGCPDIPTPNIDSLAANGVLCTSGYATHPFCSPSRAGLLTGRYQQRFGHENNPLEDERNSGLGLPLEELVLPQLLKPAGYVSGAIGKWHLGAAVNLHPLARGFDEFFGFIDGSSPYMNATVLRGETPLVEPEYLTDAFTREAESFINRHAAQPFFLYLAYNAPHAPYQATQAYLDRVDFIPDPGRRLLAAMMVALDDGVGGVLATLQARNLLNNTLIFFLSDNGAPEQTFTRNNPLRGYKTNVLEGGIRVPFAIQWTGRLPAHLVYDEPVSSLDIVATAAAAASVPLPADRVYDGLNIIPYLAGEQFSPVRTLFWRSFGLGPDGPTGSLDTIWAVRSGPLKLVTERATVGQPPALYNLPTDIGESQDLALARPGDVDSLKQLFAQWTLDTVPPLWVNATDFSALPLVLAGDWNAFNKDDSTPPWGLTRITAPGEQETPDGFNWFISTIHVAATGGDTTPGEHSFALVGAGSYSNQWGGVAINIDDVTTIPFFSGSALGPMNTISLQDGYYYSFHILDPELGTPIDLQLAVMKTSAAPISVSRTGERPAIPTPHDPITVRIATSQAKSVEERIYLRWSTDLFITSHLIEAEGSGVSYSAIIPPQPAGTLVLYTIITSTADLTAYSTSGMIDSLVLATTGVFNAVPSIPPSITTQPVDKTVTVGQAAKFRVRATGTKPLGYQWKKNGANIAGATRPSYTTPSTTLADNGALFAVVVSDRAGSITSNNATLTVVP